jgi:hypothetical protein
MLANMTFGAPGAWAGYALTVSISLADHLRQRSGREHFGLLVALLRVRRGFAPNKGRAVADWLIPAGLVLMLDQVCKGLVLLRLAEGQSIAVGAGVRIRRVSNARAGRRFGEHRWVFPPPRGDH